MQHIGIDLAWGLKAPTGLAVLDDDARLAHVCAIRTDAEIVAALEPFTAGPCIVAIDAPLLVTNPTGNRLAERELNADFARFQAGAHPTNQGKSEFSADTGDTRGGRIGKLLGLDLDPRSGRDRRGIEVYPHAATVALFRLGRTLKYKNKPGRTFPGMQSELLALMAYLSGVAELELGAPFEMLRSAVGTATRKSQLRVAEDQVDAVVCAYVAWIAVHRPDDVTTYGSPAEGSIVTPTLPPDLIPGKPTSAPDPVQAAIQAYADGREKTAATGAEALALVTGLLDEAGINYLSVAGRTKSVASFAEKAGRVVDGKLAYPDPLRDITDQIGVRVITYVQSDVEAVAELLGAQVVVHGDRDMGRATAQEGRFGYASRHLLIGVDAARAGEWTGLVGRIVQVQVRTVLQHAWAEFEHDIRYKGTVPAEHASEFDRRFTLAAGLLELADGEFTAIRERLRAPATDPDAGDDDPDDPRIAPRELGAFLAGQYADAGWSRPDHYDWISGLLLELGVTSLVELGEVLRTADDAFIASRMDYRYPPGAVRRLDDALLAGFGERYVELHGNAHRKAKLEARLRRLAGSST